VGKKGWGAAPCGTTGVARVGIFASQSKQAFFQIITQNGRAFDKMYGI